MRSSASAYPTGWGRSYPHLPPATGFSADRTYQPLGYIRLPVLKLRRTPGGLHVGGVAPGGPSAEAGLEVGDVITSIDGQAATSSVQLESLTLTRKAGDTVSIEYVRSGKPKTTITLGARPG